MKILYDPIRIKDVWMFPNIEALSIKIVNACPRLIEDMLILVFDSKKLQFLDIKFKHKTNVQGFFTVIKRLRYKIEWNPDSQLKFVRIAFTSCTDETDISSILEELQLLNSLMKFQDKKLGLHLPYINLVPESTLQEFEYLDILDQRCKLNFDL